MLRTVGYIVNTHGLKGELKIKLQTHFVDERFQRGSKLMIVKDEQTKEVVVKNARMNKGMMLVVFEELSHINDVECYKGAKLCVDESACSPLDADEIYYSDLMHMHVFTTEYKEIGIVTEIIEMGAQVCIRVNNQEKSILIPYVKRFIKEVMIEDKKLIVELLEGML